MTGRSQPAMSDDVQKARQRLMRLGLTDEHVLSLGPVPASTFDPSHLQYASSDPHFGAMVQRILRFLRGGRGLSIAVTDDGDTGEARIYTALQLATGLSRQGIQVVVVDMDFLHPGLGGLVTDEHTEGLIDMVRFGRSCRSLLYRPVAEGPSILTCGSFPVLEPMPFDEDAVRSVLHRVSLHCELALYVAPLQPDGKELNPVVRLCEHVVLVHSVSPTSVDIVERIQLMQQARLHVAGVVLFEAATHAGASEAPSQWRPDSFTPEAPPMAAPVVPEVPDPGAPHPQPSELAAQTPAAPHEVAIPHIPWNAPKGSAADPATPEAPREDEIPEIKLPTGENRSGPLAASRAAGESSYAPDAVSQGTEASHGEAPSGSSGEDVIERLWSEPSEELAAEETSADTFEESPMGGVARSSQEFDSLEFDDDGTEFAYDDGNSWSKTPLYILITLLVLTGGFFGWALWTKRGIEQQVGQQLSDTDWIEKPAVGADPGVPNDAAAMPQDDGVLPAGGLEALTKEVDPEPVAQQPEADATRPQAPATPDRGKAQKPPRVVQQQEQPPPTEEVAPIQVRPAPEKSADGALSDRQSRTPTTAIPPTTTGAGAREYTVHVGSFRHIKQAYKDIATLQKYGFTGRAVRTDLGEKGIWYRVYVGGFPTRAEAEKTRNSVLEHPEYRYAQVRRVPR